jgi:hypothetical protein
MDGQSLRPPVVEFFLLDSLNRMLVLEEPSAAVWLYSSAEGKTGWLSGPYSWMKFHDIVVAKTLLQRGRAQERSNFRCGSRSSRLVLTVCNYLKLIFFW